VRACRQRQPGLAAAPAFIIIESNSIMVAESTKREIVRLNENRVYVIEEDRRKGRGAHVGEEEIRAGTRTTNATKEWQMNAIHELLAQRALRMHAQFVVSQPDQQPANQPGEPRDHIISELRTMSVERKAPKTVTPYSKTVLKFSGRHPNGGRARDDYVMALGFILLMRPVVMNSVRWKGVIPTLTL
jgi:hypothetical protein